MLTPRLVSGATMQRIMVVRMASHVGSGKQAARQLQAPNVPGFFKYERDISRDKRYSNPQKPGDTPMRYDY